MASAPACANRLLALVQRRQPERRKVGLEMPNRVRVERRDDHRPAHVETQGDRPVHDRLVAEMKAVEIAERNHRAAKLFGNGFVVIQPVHRARALVALT